MSEVIDVAATGSLSVFAAGLVLSLLSLRLSAVLSSPLAPAGVVDARLGPGDERGGGVGAESDAPGAERRGDGEGPRLLMVRRSQ